MQFTFPIHFMKFLFPWIVIFHDFHESHFSVSFIYFLIFMDVHFSLEVHEIHHFPWSSWFLHIFMDLFCGISWTSSVFHELVRFTNFIVFNEGGSLGFKYTNSSHSKSHIFLNWGSCWNFNSNMGGGGGCFIANVVMLVLTSPEQIKCRWIDAGLWWRLQSNHSYNAIKVVRAKSNAIELKQVLHINSHMILFWTCWNSNSNLGGWWMFNSNLVRSYSRRRIKSKAIPWVHADLFYIFMNFIWCMEFMHLSPISFI